ncbi:uncharacterized protein LOC110451590 [Mizuhopecten yessoensis]|uniref:uncharacterized protein LOC110451590 n=1 Tax=Mizuhopecten yessoensis TaxID=6573 RepID=UPI000B459A34|nr:uncharacterized protein LOC110451590 [Mizuhopecten yessoensis]
MDEIPVLAELEEEELEEVEELEEMEGACGGEPRGLTLKESYVDVTLEEDQEDRPLLDVPTAPTLRLTMTIDSNKTNQPVVTVEQENIHAQSGKCYSYLSLFQQFEFLLLLSFKITVHIKMNGTVRKFKGYLAVLNVQALRTFCKPLIEKEGIDYELKTKDKHFLDMIKKTLFLNLIEKENGTPVHPRQEPNVPHPCVNASTLSSILKMALVVNMTRVKDFFLLQAVIPTDFTKLRPVLVGIRSRSKTMSRLDASDIFSFLLWPSGICNTAKDLYTKGFHCLNSARKCVQCLSCGKILELCQDSEADVCCSLRRVLNFDGPMYVESIQTYLQSMSRLFSHPPSLHLQPELENCLADQYLNPSTSADVEQFSESGLIPTGIADTYRCFSCGVQLRNWQGSHNPILTHAAVSMHCQHLLKTCGPQFLHLLRESLLQAGMTLPGYIGQHFVQHYDFRHKSGREQTWTTSSLCSFNVGRKWSDGGFFIENGHCYEKAVCFCCGIKLVNIRENDDPWAVHFSYQPNCPFLLESKPEYFRIRARCRPLTREQIKRFAEPTGHHRETEVTSDIRLRIKGILDGIDSSSFLETEKVRCLLADPPQGQASRDDREVELRILEENAAMKKQQQCRDCEKKERAVVFLPCGHFICCEDCARAFEKCPLPSCQAVIESSIKTNV